MLSKVVVVTIHYKNVAPLSSLFPFTVQVLFQDTMSDIFSGNFSVVTYLWESQKQEIRGTGGNGRGGKGGMGGGTTINR